VVGNRTKQRARFEWLASSGYFARRDGRVRDLEGMLQHGEFLCGLSVMRCALTRIMLVPDRFFKAAVGPIGGRRGKVELI
jgi:hypothetical protein